MITRDLATLKIHKLSQEQYLRELEAGNIDPDAIYLTPNDSNNSNNDAELDEHNLSEESHPYLIQQFKNLFQGDENADVVITCNGSHSLPNLGGYDAGTLYVLADSNLYENYDIYSVEIVDSETQAIIKTINGDDFVCETPMPGIDAYIADDSIWFYKVLTPYNGHSKGIYVYSNTLMKEHVGKIILKPSSSKLLKFKHLPEGGFGHMVDAAVPFYKWDGKTSGVPIVTDSTWYADINKLYKVEDLDFFAALNINSPEEIAHIAYGADGYPDTATYTKDDYTIETRKDLENNEYMVFTTPINGAYGVTERVIILIAFSTIYLNSWNADASQYGRMEFEPGLYLRYGDGTYVTTIYKQGQVPKCIDNKYLSFITTEDKVLYEGTYTAETMITPLGIVPGQKYTIQYNGIDYNFQCNDVTIEDIHGYVLGDIANQIPPVYVEAPSLNVGMFILDSDVESAFIKLTGAISKIDNNYLPQLDWNEKNSILNQPFYSSEAKLIYQTNDLQIHTGDIRLPSTPQLNNGYTYRIVLYNVYDQSGNNHHDKIECAPSLCYEMLYEGQWLKMTDHYMQMPHGTFVSGSGLPAEGTCESLEIYEEKYVKKLDSRFLEIVEDNHKQIDCTFVQHENPDENMAIIPDITLEPNKEYTIVYNGIGYREKTKIVALDDIGYLYFIGNPAIAGMDISDSNAPFLMMTSIAEDGQTIIIVVNLDTMEYDIGEHNISIIEEDYIIDPTYLPSTVPVITNAVVGQTVRIAAVDENGKPTAWEAVDTAISNDIILNDVVTNKPYKLFVTDGKLAIQEIV